MREGRWERQGERERTEMERERGKEESRERGKSCEGKVGREGGRV